MQKHRYTDTEIADMVAVLRRDYSVRVHSKDKLTVAPEVLQKMKSY